MMEVNTIENAAPHRLWLTCSALCYVGMDRAELEQRLVRGLLKHKFVVMIDDEEAAGVARDLAEEVLR